MSPDIRSRTFDPDNLKPLETWLTGELGANSIVISKASVLGGGAIGENWQLSVSVSGGPHDGTHDWVLRTDAVARLAITPDRAHEFACIKAAHEAGVMVPVPIAVCSDTQVIGASFMVVGKIDGIAQGHRIVRDESVIANGDALVEELGRLLARIHSIRPPREDLEFLALPEAEPARAQVALLRKNLDTVSGAHPALEFILAWLDENAPPRDRITLCHTDFRTGNIMIDQGRLTGILDWEFCHWGDPHFDLGWFCARCWRFGADDREAGGIGSREAFYKGYNAESDVPLDPEQIPYWEIMTAARWATIALLQGERHITGGEASIELLLTGLMSPEMEYDALAEILARQGQ